MSTGINELMSKILKKMMKTSKFQKLFTKTKAAQLISDLLEQRFVNDIPTEIPERLKFIEQFKDHSLKDGTSFLGWQVLFIQHNLGPLVSRINAMFDMGLEPENTWILDIPYSTNIEVQHKIYKNGVDKEHFANLFTDPLAPYTNIQLERLEYLLEKIIAKNSKLLLVIDDGAYFIRLIEQLGRTKSCLLKSLTDFTIRVVEQTTRGEKFLKLPLYKNILTKYNIPAVSIAKSETKKFLESPFIGKAVANSVVNKLNESENQKLKNHLGKILICGYGSVGKATVDALKNLTDTDSIYVYDPEPKQQKQASKDELHSLSEFPKEGNFNTVFGCTGKNSFSVDSLGILDDEANLISGSSGAIEFNRPKLVELANHDPNGDFFIKNYEKTRQNGIHASITMEKNKKTFTILNAGFPINFTGQIESQPYWSIQMTHALLLSAAKQVLQEQVPILHELNVNRDYWISENWLKYAAEST